MGSLFPGFQPRMGRWRGDYLVLQRRELDLPVQRFFRLPDDRHLGLQLDPRMAVGSNKRILFFNGTTWSAQFTGTVSSYSGICGLDQTHVWACGDTQVATFDGQSWTDAGTPGVTLQTISADTPTDVWAVGGNANTIRFNGISWSKVTPPDNATWYWGVDAIDATHVWVGGASETGPFFYNGNSWQQFGNIENTHWVRYVRLP